MIFKAYFKLPVNKTNTKTGTFYVIISQKENCDLLKVCKTKINLKFLGSSQNVIIRI